MPYDSGSHRSQSLERPLPHSEEAERAVLGGIILDNRLMVQALDLLKVEDFFAPSHRRIFKAMIQAFEESKQIDPIIVGDTLKNEGFLEAVGGVPFITNLTYGLPHATNITHYAGIIREKSQLRSLIKLGSKLLERGYNQEEDAETIIDSTQSDLMGMSGSRGSRVYSLKETANRTIEHLRTLQRGLNPAIATPWPQLNNACRGGLQPSELWGLIAVQKHGKSAIAKQWAWHAANSGHRVLIFSREMSDIKIMFRLMAPLSGIPVSQIRYGLDQNRIDESIRTAESMSDKRIFIDTDTADIDQAKLRTREMVRLEGVDFVIADYANQFSGIRRKGASRAEEVAYIWRSFKNLSQEFQIGTFTVGHPTSESFENPHAKKNGREAPYFHQSAESREAAKAVDVGMVLWTELSKGQPGARPAMIYIDYQRDEEAGGQIPLTFDGRAMEFYTPRPDEREIDFNG